MYVKHMWYICGAHVALVKGLCLHFFGVVALRYQHHAFCCVGMSPRKRPWAKRSLDAQGVYLFYLYYPYLVFSVFWILVESVQGLSIVFQPPAFCWTSGTVQCS